MVDTNFGSPYLFYFSPSAMNDRLFSLTVIAIIGVVNQCFVKKDLLCSP
jgi:hypothetical protein